MVFVPTAEKGSRREMSINMMSKQNYIFLGIFFVFSKVVAADTDTVVLKTLAQDTAPKWVMIKNNDQQTISGLCVDILKMIENKNDNLTFSWEKQFYPLKRMLSFLETGIINLLVSMAYNKSRAEKFIYSTPLYDVFHIAAVRKSDPVKISSFADIAALGHKGVILTVFGTATSRFLKNRPEKLIINDTGYTPVDNLNRLIHSRGRFFYYYDYGMLYSIKVGGLQEKIDILPLSFRKYQHYIIFAKTVPSFIVEQINKTINNMKKNGEMESIRKKYQ